MGGSEEWEFQSKSQSRIGQLDDPAEPPAYEEEFPFWETNCGQGLSWEDESASWGADSVASTLIETSLDLCKNLYQRRG